MSKLLDIIKGLWKGNVKIFSIIAAVNIVTIWILFGVGSLISEHHWAYGVYVVTAFMLWLAVTIISVMVSSEHWSEDE